MSEEEKNSRERILAMLEEGKISSEECTELLNAVRAAEARPKRSLRDLKPARWVVLAGMLLVLAGFFLPWAKYDLHQMMEHAPVKLTGSASGQETVPGLIVQQFRDAFPSGAITISVSGAGVKGHLGWLILFLALTSAIVPMLSLQLENRTQQAIVWGSLVVGAALLCMVLFENIRDARIGLAMVVAGYVLLVVGTLQETRKARPALAARTEI